MESRSHPGHVPRYLILAFIVIVIIIAQVAAFNFYHKQNNASGNIVNPDSNGNSKRGNCDSAGNGSSGLQVCTFINYGNGTSKWYNNTNVPVGWNFYNLTKFLTNGNIESQYYTYPLQENLILSINGVKQNSTFYWSLWEYCGNSHAWTYSKVGSDDIRLTNGSVLSWYFASMTTSDPPIPGAQTVSSCS